jgi:lysophospholipase L1-like esterase
MFLDAKLYIKPSVEDGLHLDPAGHKGLAEAVYNVLKGL